MNLKSLSLINEMPVYLDFLYSFLFVLLVITYTWISIIMNLKSKSTKRPIEFLKTEWMKQEIIEKFNAIYTGNTALSTAICNIDLGNATVQHFVQCNTKEFNDSDLTIFFINTLNNLIEDNEPIIYVSIINIGLNKAISIKTSLVHNFSVVERENHRFIKKYNLKVDKEEKKDYFLAS